MEFFFNINSILETGLISGVRKSKEGRQTIFFTPVVQMKKHSMTIYQYQGRRIATTIGNTTKMLFFGKFVSCIRSRIAILANESQRNNGTQSCPGRLHLQGDFSARRPTIVRETSNTSTCTHGDSWNKWAFAAAESAAAAATL